MRTARYHLQLISLAWVMSIAHSSVATTPKSKFGGARKASPDVEDDLNNESFKNNEDWWKDPFAMFGDDDDDFESDTEDFPPASEAMEQPLEGQDMVDELPMFEEPPIPEPVIVKPTIVEPAIVEPTIVEPAVVEPAVVEPAVVKPVVVEPVVVSPAIPEPAPAPLPPAQPKQRMWERRPPQQPQSQPQPVNPLVEQAIESQTATKFAMPRSFHVPPKVTAVWKAIPLVNLLASFAFVKVIQPVIQLAGKAVSEKKAAKGKKSEASSSTSAAEDDDDDMGDQMMRNEQDDEEDEEENVRNSYRTRPVGHASPGFLSKMFSPTTPKRSSAKLPPARELMDLVEALQRDLDTCKMEKEAMEKEYEKASWQLQENQNELATLASTTQYLKAQLRDNQEVMDRAVRAERRKARDELTKMKEAMLQVLQRERADLRAKMMKQTAEVQAILKERNNEVSR